MRAVIQRVTRASVAVNGGEPRPIGPRLVILLGVRHTDDIAIVPTFILTPRTYLGGVFYSVKLLPPWAEALTHANPIFYMVNAFRYGLLGSSDVPVWVAYTLMLAFVAALTALALWLLRRGVGLRS